MSLLHLAAAAGEAPVLARLLPLLPPSQLTEQRNPQRATPLQQGSVLVYSFPAVALALAAAALDRGL